MLLEMPPKMSVSAFAGYLKGKSGLMIYEQLDELKFKYRREFWRRGYSVDTMGTNKAKIAEYIRRQLTEDKLGDQLSIPYAGSPFYGPSATEMQASDRQGVCWWGCRAGSKSPSLRIGSSEFSGSGCVPSFSIRLTSCGAP